jgi:hypothetical protein
VTFFAAVEAPTSTGGFTKAVLYVALKPGLENSSLIISNERFETVDVPIGVCMHTWKCSFS